MVQVKMISKFFAVVAAGIFTAGGIVAPSFASEADGSTSEINFIVTKDGDFFEIEEGLEYETADEYFEENYGVDKDEYFQLEEDGDLHSTLGVGEGSTDYGTVRINSNCDFATVDYYRSGSSSISVRFRVRYNITGTVATGWSPYMSMTTRGGHTFRHTHNSSIGGVRGEMQTGGSTYVTTWASRC